MAAVSWCRDGDDDGDDDDAVTAPMSGWTEWTVWTTARAVAAATRSADLETRKRTENSIKIRNFMSGC